ncbi:hypothetical protein [Phenylobacterium soli]|uniref:hypothetical protein n=1 Tax=Phenylobacterium soli TaxID=2170551 RepID=UPI00105812C4
MLVVWGLILSSAMVNPRLHHLIDGDPLDQPTANAVVSGADASAQSVHDVARKTSEPAKAPPGVMCSGHCAAHFAGTLPPVVAQISEPPVLVSWPVDQAPLRPERRPFSLERPPRV